MADAMTDSRPTATDTRSGDPPTPGFGAGSPGAARERRIAAFESEVAEVCGQLHWAHARLVGLTADALEHGWWAQSGVRSVEHWLCWQTGVSSAHAARLVAVARRRDELPVTMAAFDAGALSLDQVMPIVTHAPAWADAQACSLAQRCTVGQIRTLLRRYCFDGHDRDEQHGSTPQPVDGHDTADRDRPETHPDDPVAETPGTGEYWSFHDDGSGCWRASGRVEVDHALVIDAALREIADALFHETGQVPSGVEALTEMAHRSLQAVTDRSRRDRYRVHLLLDEQHRLHDPLGQALPAWLRDLLTCDMTMAVTWMREGTPIAQGSTAETIPGAVRRHVLARDGGCRVPGCGRRTRLDLHHVVHRQRGGTNDTSNLIAICPQHHRAHHRGQLGIAGDADRPDHLTFTDATGRPIALNRCVRPPTRPPSGGTYLHPIGERLQMQWVQFNPPSAGPPPTIAPPAGPNHSDH